MNQNDKRSSVCRLAFLPVALAKVTDKPGSMFIQVQGTFIPIPISSAEFRETEKQGTAVEQELKAAVTCTGSDCLASIRETFNQDGLILIGFTNGEQKIIGTDEFPVHVDTELSGTPKTLTLSFTRNSAEPAKVYSSF